MPSGLFDTPKSVKSLRKYWKDKSPPDTSQLIAELHGKSDRSAIILMATILDDSLAFLLSSRFIFFPDDKRNDYIFRLEGPLGSFSSRIEISYLFGIIDERCRDQLNFIREMRNACAHSKHLIDFSTPELASVAKRVCHPSGFLPLINNSTGGLRASFFMETILLFQMLIHGSREKANELAKEVIDQLLSSLAPSPDKSPSQ